MAAARIFFFLDNSVRKNKFGISGGLFTDYMRGISQKVLICDIDGLPEICYDFYELKNKSLHQIKFYQDGGNHEQFGT